MRFGSGLGAGWDRSSWLASLFLVVGVVAPTACVLWFMNEAAQSQAESARQSVAEAYRGQLRFLRDRIDAFWLARAAALQRARAGLRISSARSRSAWPILSST